MNDEFQIIAVLIEDKRSVEKQELSKFLLQNIPNARIKVNRLDSSTAYNLIDEVIYVAGAISSTIAIAQVFYSAYCKFVKEKESNKSTNLMIQIKKSDGTFIQMNLNTPDIEKTAFIAKFQDEFEVKFGKKDD